MSVHPSIRLAATPTADGAAAVPGDASGIAELFNQLVAGLNGDEGKPNGDDATATAEAEQPAEATPTQTLAASVEQLIAVITGHHGSAPHGAKAKTDETGDKGSDTPDAATPPPQPNPTTQIATAAPLPAPAVAASVAAQPAALPVTVAATATAVTPDASAPTAQAAAATQTPTAQPQGPDQSASTQQDATLASPDPGQQNPKPTVQPQPVAIPTAFTAVTADDPIQALARSLLADISSQITGRPASSERSHVAEAPLPVLGGDQPAAAVQPAVQPAAPFQAPAAQPLDLAVPQPLQGLVIERQLDLAHQQDWIDQLARDIAGAAGGDGKALRFRLNPENLGSLHVEIAQSHHGAAVRISADTETARTIIADAQQRLVAEARAQGVRISETHVDLGSGGSSGDPRRQAALRSEEAPVRTARSLREDEQGDGKPTPNGRDLYA